jgi:uncharacterized repeat protein (TIGR03806 family)
MNKITSLLGSIAFLTLAGCGGGGGSSSIAELPSGASCEYDASAQTENGVQWDNLISINATNLSEFQLFQDSTDPTTNPQTRGLPYDLSVPLFTDYASKYRFIFMPPGCSAKYIENEVFEFPVGTTLVKSFAMPTNTANRGIENEDLIETRLLVKRTTGWVTLPYIWNTNKTDATLLVGSGTLASRTFDKTVTHNGVTSDFTYTVPTNSNCGTCHAISDDNESTAYKIPIGPKARYLNKNYDFSDGSKNQLTKWVEEQFLAESTLPSLENVDLIPSLDDSSDIGAMTSSELETASKAWLDINCAHCHRSDPNGDASNTNMHVEWNRNFATDASSHGVCQIPVSFSVTGVDYDIEPGDAESSAVIVRMKMTDGQLMPKLGRTLVHAEGVELISTWINSMPTNAACNQ